MAIARGLPTGVADAPTGAPTRAGRYGESYTVPVGGKQTTFADEGSYFVSQNPTSGTAVTGHAAPVANDLALKPLLHIFNGGTNRIYLDFIRMTPDAAGTSSTNLYFTLYVDKHQSTNRVSGGSLCAPLNVNLAESRTSSGVIYFGAVVATSQATEIRLDNAHVSTVIPSVNDMYILTFGQTNISSVGSLGGAAASKSIVIPMVPAIVPPGGNLKLCEWGASHATAKTWEYTLGFWER